MTLYIALYLLVGIVTALVVRFRIEQNPMPITYWIEYVAIWPLAAITVVLEWEI